MKQILGARWKDMVHVPLQEGFLVSYGLSSKNGPPYVSECVRLGPTEQLGPLYGSRVTPRRLLMGAFQLTRAALTVPYASPMDTKPVGPVVHGL